MELVEETCGLQPRSPGPLSLSRSRGREGEDPGNEVVWLAERSEPCSPEFISLAEIIMREDGLIMP